MFLDLSLYRVTITFFFGSSSIPVDTRRRFDVDTTSFVYWDKLYVLDVISVFEIN